MGDRATVRMMVVDDHPLMRCGLATLLNAQPGWQVIAEAPDGETAVALYAALRPDVSFVDLRLPGISGAEVIRAIRRRFAASRLIVMTTYAGDMEVQEALDAGASAYLLKGMTHDEVLTAVRAVCAGRTHLPAALARRVAESAPRPVLTGRERDVLELLARGKDNREIAASLQLKVTTVKWFVKAILGKLYARNRTEAAYMALERGIIR